MQADQVKEAKGTLFCRFFRAQTGVDMALESGPAGKPMVPGDDQLRLLQVYLRGVAEIGADARKSRQRFDLLSALSIKWILLPEASLVKIRSAALNACAREANTFSRDLRAVCGAYPAIARQAECGGSFKENNKTPVLLRSDPTNACAHTRFRLLLEGVTILQPALLRNSAPESVTLLAQQQLAAKSSASGLSGQSATQTKSAGKAASSSNSSANTLLFGANSNFALRSPNEIMQYLGDVVKTMHTTGSGPTLTGPNGKNIPIFEVHTGPLGIASSIEVSVDGERFSVRTHQLREYPRSFTLQSLAILKDIISVNTSQQVLPKNPTLFLK